MESFAPILQMLRNMLRKVDHLLMGTPPEPDAAGCHSRAGSFQGQIPFIVQPAFPVLMPAHWGQGSGHVGAVPLSIPTLG